MTRILVKMPNWVGDCVMATPALALLKSALPHAQIDLLVRPSVAGILEDNPHKAQLIVANDREMPPEVLAGLKEAGYAAVVLLTNSLRSAWMAARIGAKIRVGFNREGRGLLLTHKIPFQPLEWQTPTEAPLSRRSIKGIPKPGWPRHMVEYYLELARTTITALEPSHSLDSGLDFHLALPLQRSSEEKIARLLRENAIQKNVLIGINPGAAHGPAKRWPPELLGRAIEMLNRPDWAFVSTAGPGERELNDAVEDVAGFPLHRLGEVTTLRELPALISRLGVLITNDSGPMHIAAARNVPTVAIFGPTDPPSTYPWQAPHTIVRNPVPCSPCFLETCPIHHPCMRGISSFQVAEATLSLLQKSGRWTAAPA